MLPTVRIRIGASIVTRPRLAAVLRASERFLAGFTEDLVDLELGPVSAEVRVRTRDWVVDRVRGSATITRAGLAAAGALVAATVVLRTGGTYGRLPAERRRELARGLAASALPVVADYVKAVRSLAVTYVWEART